jgi:hypothetical protein
MSKVIKLLLSIVRLLIASVAILAVIPILITAIWVSTGCYGGSTVLRDILSCEFIVFANIILSGIVIGGLLSKNEI